MATPRELEIDRILHSGIIPIELFDDLAQLLRNHYGFDNWH